MKPFLHTVTITGLDTSTDLGRVAELQKRYPFVEWGVLLSETKTGTHPRYPHFNWIALLTDQGLRLAGHLCGAWARDVTKGQMPATPDLTHFWPLFRRVQLNVSNVLKNIESDSFVGGIELLEAKLTNAIHDPIIVQVGRAGMGSFEDHLKSYRVLFDASGGRGVETQDWPKAGGLNCGYAGGLNPDNLRENIFRIFDAAQLQEVWIDVESGVRDGDDCLDLNKVAAFLDIAQAYVVDQ